MLTSQIWRVQHDTPILHSLQLAWISAHLVICTHTRAYRNNFRLIYSVTWIWKECEHQNCWALSFEWFYLNIRQLFRFIKMEISQLIFNTYEIFFVNAPVLYIDCNLKCSVLNIKYKLNVYQRYYHTLIFNLS